MYLSWHRMEVSIQDTTWPYGEQIEGRGRYMFAASKGTGRAGSWGQGGVVHAPPPRRRDRNISLRGRCTLLVRMCCSALTGSKPLRMQQMIVRGLEAISLERAAAIAARLRVRHGALGFWKRRMALRALAPVKFGLKDSALL